MRVSKDAADKAFDVHAEKRRVWYKDVEVLGWVTADEFRRVIVRHDGTVLNGAVLVERIPEDAPVPEEAPVEIPAPITDSGFVGLMVHVHDVLDLVQEPVVEELTLEPIVEHAPEPIVEHVAEAPAAEPQIDLPLEETPPGDPDPVVVDTPSERLPDEGSQE